MDVSFSLIASIFTADHAPSRRAVCWMDYRDLLCT